MLMNSIFLLHSTETKGIYVVLLKRFEKSFNPRSILETTNVVSTVMALRGAATAARK